MMTDSEGRGANGAVRQAHPATLVIGLGNPLRGDDGIGVKVAQVLAEVALPDDVEVVDGGTQGLAIVNLMEGRRRVIVVDAAELGKAPGQFERFTPYDARLLGDDQHLSVHAAGFRDALLLAEALEVLPDEVIIFGVQPANLEWTNVLSPEVEVSLPSLITAVLEDVAAGTKQSTRG